MACRTSRRKWGTVAFVIIALMMLAGECTAIAQKPKGGARTTEFPNCGSATGSAGSPRSVKIDDYACVKKPSEARISRDGKHIAYVVDSEVQVITADGGGASTPLSPPDEWGWGPVWSRDNKSLYFLSTASTPTKLWKVSISGNREPSMLTCFSVSVPDLKLSPDETRLLMEMNNVQDRSGVGPPFASPECVEPEETESKPIVVTGLEFKEDYNGHLAAEKRYRIYSFDISSGDLTQLTDTSEQATAENGGNHDTDAAWSPDGEQVAFIREYPSTLKYSSELWITSSRGPQRGVPTKLISSPEAERRSPSWRGDGQLLAYLLSDGRDGPLALKQLAVYSLTEGTEKILTKGLDRTIVSFRFSADGSSIYFIYADAGGQYLAQVRLSDGRIEYLITGEHVVELLDVSGDDRLAVAMTPQNKPAEMYVVGPGQQPSRVTNINSAYFEGLTVAPKEKVLIAGAGGIRFEAFVTKPINFDRSRKYPAVLNIHGGPVEGQFSYGYEFFSQLLAANGYVVVEPNPPASLGHGRKQIRKIYRNWGCTEYPDVLPAIDYVIAAGLADSKKLAVTGYSYGGYMTNCVITRTPKKFKVAASGAGHSLIAANFGHDVWLKWYNWELGAPWLNRRLYAGLSPLNRAGYVVTPTLFLGGAEDWNVPILNSELFYEALRIRGVKTQLVVYPDVGHGNWGNEFNKDYYRRILRWFDDDLK